MLNRRRFLYTSAAATLGGTCLGLAGCTDTSDGAAAGGEASTRAATGTQTLSTLGVQLYTLRSLMEEDVNRTLEQVAGIGYDHVEMAGYFDHTPQEIRAMLDAHGLTAPSAHVPLEPLENDLDSVLEAAQVIGHQYIICPWLAPDQRSMETYRRLADVFNQVGETCQAAGIQFAYHNHEFEFEEEDDTIPYDYLLDTCDPNLVAMELDLFWIDVAGYDPLTYFERYPGRFKLAHVKDRNAEGEMVSVGDGVIDFATIFAHADQAGLEHFIVEHDNPEDPIASIQSSYTYLSTLEFG